MNLVLSLNHGSCRSHNPPQPSMLDIYDRLGVVVMNENREFGDAASLDQNMANLVRRDRHHPSVVIWSYCNEGRYIAGSIAWDACMHWQHCPRRLARPHRSIRRETSAVPAPVLAHSQG